MDILPAGFDHVKIAAEEDLTRCLAARGYGPHAICRSLSWLNAHGTLDTCPYIRHDQGRSATVVARYARERAETVITGSN